MVIIIIVIIVLLVKNHNRKKEINNINEHLLWQDWKQQSKIGNLDIYLYEYDEKNKCILCHFTNSKHSKGKLRVYCPKEEYEALGKIKNKKVYYRELDNLTQKYKHTFSYKN